MFHHSQVFSHSLNCPRDNSALTYTYTVTFLSTRISRLNTPIFTSHTYLGVPRSLTEVAHDGDIIYATRCRCRHSAVSDFFQCQKHCRIFWRSVMLHFHARGEEYAIFQTAECNVWKCNLYFKIVRISIVRLPSNRLFRRSIVRLPSNSYSETYTSWPIETKWKQLMKRMKDEKKKEQGKDYRKIPLGDEPASQPGVESYGTGRESLRLLVNHEESGWLAWKGCWVQYSTALWARKAIKNNRLIKRRKIISVHSLRHINDEKKKSNLMSHTNRFGRSGSNT